MEKDWLTQLEAAFEEDTQKHEAVDLCKIETFAYVAERLLMNDFYTGDAKALAPLADEMESALKEFLPDGERRKQFYAKLPEIRRLLNGTIDAIFEGDPAALNRAEIVFTYPGFKAILGYRVAHAFTEIGEDVLARIIAEYYHSETGIDIAPKATIGERFFIDHGTGIVIGETAIIGNNVKLYQGATIGALSLAEGRALSGVKRHPTIEDNVTIYSNASIFGGETVIGKNSTIGANVYITRSIEPNSIVRLGNTGIVILKK